MDIGKVILRWALVIDGVITRTNETLPYLGRDEEGEAAPITEQEASALGWVEIANAEPPSFDDRTQSINDRPVISLVNGVPTADWGLRDLAAEEAVAAKETYNDAQRALRQHAFANECDPLVGKMARGETAKDESGTEVPVDQAMIQRTAAAIRERFPYRE